MQIKAIRHRLSSIWVEQHLTVEIQNICNELSQQLERHQQRFDNRSDTWKSSRIGRYQARMLYTLFIGISEVEDQLHINDLFHK